jgi:hypothetical protein
MKLATTFRRHLLREQFMETNVCAATIPFLSHLAGTDIRQNKE